MKRNILFAIISLVIFVLISGCKKDDIPVSAAPINAIRADSNRPVPDKPEDYASHILNKTWWGSFKYTGQTEEYYSIYFKADSTLVWDELAGSFAGHWLLNDKTLTVTFDNSGSSFSAGIEGDKFSDIIVNAPYYELNSGQVIEGPNIPLDGSSWSGTAFNGKDSVIAVGFLTGNTMVYVEKYYTSFLGPLTYSRSPSGGVIRVNDNSVYGIFYVVASDDELRGSWDSYQNEIKIKSYK